MQVSKIITALGALTPAELIAVRAAVNRLLGEKTAPVVTASPLYEALMQVSGQKMPFEVFINTKFGRGFTANQHLIDNFIQDNWPSVKSVVDYFAMCRYLVALLAEDLRRCDMPVKMGSLALNLHTIPDVYEYSFPGYRVSGLNHLVLSQVIK